MRKQIVVILVCILIFTGLTEIQIESGSLPDSNIEPEDKNDQPAIIPEEPEIYQPETSVEQDQGNMDYNIPNENFLPTNKNYESISTQKNNAPVPQINNEIDIYNTNTQQQIILDHPQNDPIFDSPEVNKVETIKKQPDTKINTNNVFGYFTKNQGQVNNDSVRYYIQNGGVWFMDDGVVFELRENVETRGRGSGIGGQGDELLMDSMAGFEPPKPVEYSSVIIKLEFWDGNSVKPIGRNRLSWNNNYFYGNDSTKWCIEVPNFNEIVYENIYDNIDLRYYKTQQGLKYDFIVHPNGKPNDIKLKIEGADGIYIDKYENLKIKTELGEIEDSKLYIYQQIEESKKKIPGRFKLFDQMTYGFEISNEYDKEFDLIIDPFLNYSTYVGGSSHDYNRGLEIDSAGNAYATGFTYSFDFPTTLGAFQKNYSAEAPYLASYDIFVYKLDPNGANLLYSTYIGGNRSDASFGIAVDKLEQACITGETYSSNFPTTKGAHDTTKIPLYRELFILKLNSFGSSLIFSTFVSDTDNSSIGKNGSGFGRDIELDSYGNVYVTGTVDSNISITPEAFDTSFNGFYDVIVIKLNPNGSKLIYSTYIGGKSYDHGVDISVDAEGYTYVTGQTYSSDFPTTDDSYDPTYNFYQSCFVLKLDKNGSNLIYSTFMGVNSTGTGIDIDNQGNAYLTGFTLSPEFPTTQGAYQSNWIGTNGTYNLYVLKLNSMGSALEYSTFIGGKNHEMCNDIAVDQDGNAYITGYTSSSDFPITNGSYDNSLDGYYEGFFLKLNSDGSKPLYSSFIGGNSGDEGWDIEFGSNNQIYVSGQTASSDFPVTPSAFDTSLDGNFTLDNFVLKIEYYSLNNPPIISSFTATHSLEGSKVIFTVNATDPENDPLTYSFDFQNDSIFEYVGEKNTSSYTWGDDYSGTAVVKVSDGNLSVQINTSVVVYNSKPILKSINVTNVTKVSQNVTREWVTKYGSAEHGAMLEDIITTKSSDYIYVTGTISANKTGYDYVTIKYDTYGKKLWEKRYDGPGNSIDWPDGIGVDFAGNVYVTGRSQGNSANWDYATVAYNPMGKELWVSRYNGLGNGLDWPYAIAVNSSGYVYVTGESKGNGKSQDLTTIAYDQNGKEQWVSRYYNTNVSGSCGCEIDLDMYGNVYVGGVTIVNKTNYNYITIKYDSNGNELWTNNYNGPGNGFDFVNDMKVSKIGNVYITGSSNGNGTDSDYATIKYNSTGACQWINRYNGPGNTFDSAQSIDIDPNENVYVTGISNGVTDQDFATIAYNSAGKKLWVAGYDGPGNGHDNAYAIAADSFGNVYVTGNSYSNSTYDDIAIIAYTAKGEQLWVERYNGPGNYSDGGYRITIDSLENIYVAGYWISQVNGRSVNYITIKYSTLKCYECDEGTSLTFKALGFDPGSDDLNFTWDWYDGTNISTHIYYNNNKNQDPNPSPWGTYPFIRTDLVSNTYGDNGVFLIRLYLSDDDGGLTTYRLRIIVNNIAPKIKEILPCTIYEGESFNLSTFAVDPGSDDLEFNWSLENVSNIINIYYNNGFEPDPYPSPNGTFPFSVNDSINYIFPDDGIYNLSLTVTDDDGLNSTYLTRIIVKNVAPKVNVSVIKTEIDKKQSANLSVRIAGEKWHDVKVDLLRNNKIVTNGTLVRYPGSPNEQMLHFRNHTVNSSAIWTAILYYTPDDDPVNGKPNGATPCWVILNLSNGKQIKLHHTFKVKHKKTHIWRVNLTKVLPANGNSTGKGTFNITVFDPGADNISLYLDFGDGTNITRLYPNKNQTFPVIINLTSFHDYPSSGSYTVILIAKDDDGGITTVKLTLDFG